MGNGRSQASSARVWSLFKQLSPVEQLRLVTRMERETREKRWDDLIKKLSHRFRKHPVSDEEITRIVEEVRKERYERSKSPS